LTILKAPSVSTMAWLKVFDNSLDYSLANTAKQALWLPTSRVAKYKAKQAVDSFFMRAGDVVQAGIVFVGERLAFTVPAFAVVNVVMALGWIGIVAALNPAYRAQIDSTRQPPEAKSDAVSSAPVAVQRPREATF
jgi:AAA family ATP:ADP antiporter